MGTVVGGNYQSIYTGEQIDALLGKVNAGVTPVTGKGINLLDNWYFGNADAIIDQRGGYVVPSGVTYYSDTALTTSVGTTSAYTKATYVNTTYGKITISNTTYYVAYADMVRGYTGVGYGIDRWVVAHKSGSNYPSNCTVTLSQDGVTIQNSSPSYDGVYTEKIENLTPGTYTISMLYDNASGGTPPVHLGVYPIGSGASIVDVWVPAGSGLVYKTFQTTELYAALRAGIIIQRNSTVRIKAIKLELGDTQTLAHNEGTDANPNWMLSDPPPNYAEELAKCQRYQQQVNIGKSAVVHVGIAQYVPTSPPTWNVFIPTPVTLAKSPAVASMFVSGTFYINFNNGSFLLTGNPVLQSRTSGGVEIQVQTASAVSGATTGATGILLATGTPSIILDANL